MVNARLKRESYRKVYKRIKTTGRSIYIRQKTQKTEKDKENERKKTNEMC